MSWDGIFYDKYKIAHTDGTPLKGKRYFVLRLDSDDPVEAARVRAAMRAYEKKPRNCDAGTVEELLGRHSRFCAEQKEFAKSMGGDPALCVMNTCRKCFAKWMLDRWPEEEENGHKQ